MTKKILFIGDSITRGVCGVNYVDIIQAKNPKWKCVNKGVNGDTLIGITDRLLAILTKEPDKYCAIVLEAGHNDIVLPAIQNQSPAKKAYVLAVQARGSEVTNLNRFEKVLEQRIKKILSLTQAKIFITTLTCLGENLKSDLNQNRYFLNKAIKRLAKKYKLNLVDVSQEFDSVLEEGMSSDYFLDSALTLIIDLACSRHKTLIEREGGKRGLRLTIDGGHLNSRGAKIYAQTIGQKLKEII